jgi:hypothetical protein
MPANPFNAAKTDWTRARVEAPDKFYSGPFTRLSASVKPSVSAPATSTASTPAVTSPESTTTETTPFPTPVVPVQQDPETKLANQKAWWMNLFQTNPQSFEATLQSMSHRVNVPGANNPDPRVWYEHTGGDAAVADALGAYFNLHGYYPSTVNPTDPMRFISGQKMPYL